jgi:flagellar protein FlgJ
MIKPILPGASLTPAKAPDPALKKAAQGFEAVFLREMIGSMRKAKLAEDDLFGSSATDNFRELADANLAETMSGLGQFGISALVEAQLAKFGASS